MLLRETLRGRPSDAQSGEAARTVSYHDPTKILDSSVTEYLLDHRQELRGVLPCPDRVELSAGLPRSACDTCDVGGRVDRQPRLAHTGVVSSTKRRAGSASYDNWKCRSSGGAHGRARSGHSIRMIARSRVMSSKPRSRASSGWRRR